MFVILPQGAIWAVDVRRMRGLRRQLGLTQRQLAERLDVDQGTVSRWERGVESPRPARLAALHALLRKDEARRHLRRALALVRNDLMPSTLLDERLILADLSTSARRHIRARGVDPEALKGKDLDSYVDRFGCREVLDHVNDSGLARGDAVLFRFTVNVRGQGHTTVWEPIFDEGRVSGVLNYVSRYFPFPENDEVTVERVDFVPMAGPEGAIVMHRGPRERLLPR